MHVESGVGLSYRQCYHAALDRVLQLQGLSMDVLCEGCDDGVNGFWRDVADGHCRARARQTSGEWVIPLAACERVSTATFAAE